MKLTARDIQRLIAKRETATLECKEAAGGLPDSLWESYSAFANTDGGVILLGVRESADRLTITGVSNAAIIEESFDPERTIVKVSLENAIDDGVGQSVTAVGQKEGQKVGKTQRRWGKKWGRKPILCQVICQLRPSRCCRRYSLTRHSRIVDSRTNLDSPKRR